ncbi:Protein-lysine N-methyltransferase efm6 [Teratosphaeriaceae sp. CCFEE 6253]|nr:Protein-lysine N-methyltransferase efm6 [Teratosphaeriaceae sp. CCFEE 6253]
MSDRDADSDDNATVFAISEDLVQSPTHKQASVTQTELDGTLHLTPLLLSEDLAKGNGGQAWPAGRVLAKYLLRSRRSELRQAASIVELGAGGGLVGLAVAVGCRPGAVVHITDQEPMLDLMQRNISLNGVEGRVEASVYEWGSARPATVPAHPDVVVAADCVYFEPAFPLLLQTLSELIGPETTCYFCFKRRRRADMQFLKAAKKAFDVRDIEDDCDAQAYVRENIFLYAVTQVSPLG